MQKDYLLDAYPDMNMWSQGNNKYLLYFNRSWKEFKDGYYITHGYMSRLQYFEFKNLKPGQYRVLAKSHTTHPQAWGCSTTFYPEVTRYFKVKGAELKYYRFDKSNLGGERTGISDQYCKPDRDGCMWQRLVFFPMPELGPVSNFDSPVDAVPQNSLAYYEITLPASNDAERTNIYVKTDGLWSDGRESSERIKSVFIVADDGRIAHMARMNNIWNGWGYTLVDKEHRGTHRKAIIEYDTEGLSPGRHTLTFQITKSKSSHACEREGGSCRLSQREFEYNLNILKPYDNATVGFVRITDENAFNAAVATIKQAYRFCRNFDLCTKSPKHLPGTNWENDLNFTKKDILTLRVNSYCEKFCSGGYCVNGIKESEVECYEPLTINHFIELFKEDREGNYKSYVDTWVKWGYPSHTGRIFKYNKEPSQIYILNSMFYRYAYFRLNSLPTGKYKLRYYSSGLFYPYSFADKTLKFTISDSTKISDFRPVWRNDGVKIIDANTSTNKLVFGVNTYEMPLRSKGDSLYFAFDYEDFQRNANPDKSIFLF